LKNKLNSWEKSLWKPLPLYDKKNEILIDWSAKGGSILIVSMFFEQMGLSKKAQSHSGWIHDYRCDIFQGSNKKHNYPPRSIDQILSKQTYKIKITRNPYTRAVSSYCHVMRTKIKNQNNLDTSTSFIDFLKYILKCPFRNIHWQPQIRSREKTQKDFFNMVCKLENISEDMQQVNEEIGTSFDFESQIKKTRHPHHLKHGPGTWAGLRNLRHLADIPWSKFNPPNFPDYKYFYNQESYDLVSKIYSDDIERYNYSYEDLESWEEFNERIGESQEKMKEVKTEFKEATIAIDFDGVIHQYSKGFQGLDNAYDPPMPGVIPSLQKLKDAGYRLIIVSSRPVHAIRFDKTDPNAWHKTIDFIEQRETKK